MSELQTPVELTRGPSRVAAAGQHLAQVLTIKHHP